MSATKSQIVSARVERRRNNSVVILLTQQHSFRNTPNSPHVQLSPPKLTYLFLQWKQCVGGSDVSTGGDKGASVICKKSFGVKPFFAPTPYIIDAMHLKTHGKNQSTLIMRLSPMYCRGKNTQADFIEDAYTS
jgi:hypothetical protein